MPDKRLTDNQFDVLWNLSDTDLLAPMDFGGYNGSHHTKTACRLADQGLVEVQRRRGFLRNTNRYRRTRSGRIAYERERDLREAELTQGSK